MFKKMGLALVGILLILLLIAAVQKPEYTITRSITIEASADKIFPYLNSTIKGEEWGPWKAEDPQMVMSNSGPQEGVGAMSSWKSPGKMGVGSATITESVPNEKVTVKLQYTEPYPMEQMSWYLLEANGAQSVVTWKVTGQNNFIGRFMCLFFNMDKMVGGMFERGLGNLKTLVEKPAI